VPRGLSRFEGISPKLVRIDDVRAVFCKEYGERGLTRSDASSEADYEHAGLLPAFALQILDDRLDRIVAGLFG
jgi:hypothetical protein